jgi:Tfp pilus assembly pilus retraction ATPase PilT
MQTGQKFGMQTMEAALKDLINRKIISPEEAEGIIDETLTT